MDTLLAVETSAIPLNPLENEAANKTFPEREIWLGVLSQLFPLLIYLKFKSASFLG